MRYLPIIAAAVSTLVIGGIWYSPALFARPWARGVGFDMDDPQFMATMRKQAWMNYLSAVIAAAVTACVFYIFRNLLGIDSAAAGVRFGLLCWAGFVAPVKFVDAIFGKRGQKVLLIEAGYHLVTFVVMAVIICAWRP